MENAAPEQLEGAIAAAVSRLLGKASYTVMELCGGRLRVCQGLTRDAERLCNSSDGAEIITPALEELLSRRRTVSVLRRDDANFLAGHGVIASPIVGRNDRLLGALVFHTLEPSVLAKGVEASVLALCGSIGVAWSTDGAVMDFDPGRIAVRPSRGAIEEAGASILARATDGGAERVLVVVAGHNMRQRTAESYDAKSERRQTP